MDLHTRVRTVVIIEEETDILSIETYVGRSPSIQEMARSPSPLLGAALGTP